MRAQIRFIVMGNIFNAEVPIHQKYDLKGSRHGRYVKNKAAATIWKDLDLDIEIQLPAPWKARLDRQLSADARFLQAQQVMDYSMLVGIHFKARDEARSLLLLVWYCASVQMSWQDRAPTMWRTCLAAADVGRALSHLL